MKSNLTTSGFFQQLVNLDACCPVFSGIIERKNAKITILDGNNNPGFSGGPIFLETEILLKQTTGYSWESFLVTTTKLTIKIGT